MIRIVIAEDSEESRVNLVDLLEKNDYSVRAFEDGQQALEYLSDNPIDLVMTDIQMPILDGYGLINGLNHLNRTNPILVYASEFDRSKVQYAGKIRFLSKAESPTNEEKLAEVRAALE